MSELPTLDLSTLGEPPGSPALSVAKGQSLAEAAAVCLEDHKHAQGVVLHVQGDAERQFVLFWPVVTPQVQRTYADLQDATTDGACAVAFLVVRELSGFTVIHQARKGGGFDYWLGSRVEDMFQNATRLEVSGILSGDDASIRRRIREKRIQPERSDDLGFPAIVCVVEFSRPTIHFVKR